MRSALLKERAPSIARPTLVWVCGVFCVLWMRVLHDNTELLQQYMCFRHHPCC